MEILVGQVACLEFNFFTATFGEGHLSSQCDRITALKFGNYSRHMKCCQHLKTFADSRNVSAPLSSWVGKRKGIN